MVEQKQGWGSWLLGCGCVTTSCFGGGSGRFPSENDLDNFRFDPGSTALDGRMNKDSEGYITLQMARK